MKLAKPSDFQPHLDLDLTGRRVAVDPQTRRISVRVANLGESHSGFGEQVRVPRNANLEAAHVGVADLEDGTSLRVAVLPMDTKHAPSDLEALHAASWYEESGKGVARGRYSHDEHGVRFDGILFDDVTDAQLSRLTAGSASGDWRSAIAIKKFSDYEHTPCDFVGSCIVNIPGYSDTFRSAPASRFALVASAAGDLLSIETVENDVDPNRIIALTASAVEELVKTAPTGNAKDRAIEALQAGGEPCTGGCGTCDGSCGGEKGEVPEGSIVLTASAAKRLLDLATADGGVTPDETKDAVDEAMNALTAGGFIEVPDPRDARIAALEQIVIQQAFRD